jgi:hypothetical protein
VATGVPTPSIIALWIAISTTHYGVGDRPVGSVIICGEEAVNRGADTKYMRPHAAIMGLDPRNQTVMVGPIFDCGFYILVFAVGATKPVWGPTAVKAGGKSIAAIAVPFSPIGPNNQLVCSDPCDLPNGLAVQMPSSVFVGMSLADYFLCTISIAVDMLISFVLNLLFGGVEFVQTFFGEKLAKAAARRLGPKLGQGLAGFAKKIGEWVAGKVPKILGKELGDYVKEITSKILEEAGKKGAGWLVGLIPGPDERLGFGEGPPPAWAR